jgi:hypothetical protein
MRKPDGMGVRAHQEHPKLNAVNRCIVACVPVEYSMMNKLKLGLIRSTSALALVVALLALSLAFGALKASAEDIATPPEVELSPASEIQEPAVDAATSPASEGQAVRVEITQTATVAVVGQDTDGNEAIDITGSVPSSGVAADQSQAQEPEPVVQQPAE